MKKVIVLGAFIVAFAANSFAQTDNQVAPITEKTEQKRGEGRAAKKAFKNELNLSADQKTRMKEIGGTTKGKLKAIKTDNTLSKEQKRAQALEVQKGSDAEVKSVLTAEQYAKFSEKKQMRREKMKARRSGN